MIFPRAIFYLARFSNCNPNEKKSDNIEDRVLKSFSEVRPEDARLLELLHPKTGFALADKQMLGFKIGLDAVLNERLPGDLVSGLEEPFQPSVLGKLRDVSDDVFKIACTIGTPDLTSMAIYLYIQEVAPFWKTDFIQMWPHHPESAFYAVSLCLYQNYRTIIDTYKEGSTKSANRLGVAELMQELADIVGLTRSYAHFQWLYYEMLSYLRATIMKMHAKDPEERQKIYEKTGKEIARRLKESFRTNLNFFSEMFSNYEHHLSAEVISRGIFKQLSLTIEQLLQNHMPDPAYFSKNINYILNQISLYYKQRWESEKTLKTLMLMYFWEMFPVRSYIEDFVHHPIKKRCRKIQQIKEADIGSIVQSNWGKIRAALWSTEDALKAPLKKIKKLYRESRKQNEGSVENAHLQSLSSKDPACLILEEDPRISKIKALDTAVMDSLCDLVDSPAFFIGLDNTLCPEEIFNLNIINIKRNFQAIQSSLANLNNESLEDGLSSIINRISMSRSGLTVSLFPELVSSQKITFVVKKNFSDGRYPNQAWEGFAFLSDVEVNYDIKSEISEDVYYLVHDDDIETDIAGFINSTYNLIARRTKARLLSNQGSNTSNCASTS